MIHADPLWYQDAVIYQLHVRAYQDSNEDGIGDFRGLTRRLDYLQELGVNALWLLPFYPSPLKDDGYDIADYTSVNPSYGTLRDFQAFLDGAHARGMRVINELVMNHTSDQHPWFQRARRAPAGSPERDFYVWSDTQDRYRDARIIFQDFEPSNWTLDPVAGAYYWHRFFHHQPDLNFENPAVREAMFQSLDFWLERGVDGVRLDAVPYLFEREGTTCENLPETHDFLKQVRRHIDERYPNRMLLAEANMWPEDAIAYFGASDECHMAFHFPVMPRLFMAVQREDRFPIIDILQQTPAAPPGCQWTMFLRNHDELTLEMVTDEERDYMYRVYAADPRARINLGIRRRLAPLLKNNRRMIELLNGLLFTMPGTPVVYYGDEIGMGDNIYLGDRDSVRTPMQWNSDRNAGFSRANSQRLYLPVNADAEFHYSTVNVEVQEDNPNSLLHWMRRLISMRTRSHVFGRGSLEFLLPENPRVLAFIRQYEEETVLVVANLSRYPQYVELDLSRFQGLAPVEVFGKTRFPPIGELPYLLTLGEHAFQLFSLQRVTEQIASIAERSAPTERFFGTWEELFQPASRARLEAALQRFLQQQRWFLGGSETIRSVTVTLLLPLKRADGSTFGYFTIASVDYLERDPELYAVPFAWAQHDLMSQVLHEQPRSVLLRLLTGSGEESGVLYDATGRPDLNDWWLRLLRDPNPPAFDGAEVERIGFHADTMAEFQGELPAQTPVAGRTHTWTRLGDAVVIKSMHFVDAETSPEVELSGYLRRHAPRDLVPEWFGGVEVRPAESRAVMTIASVARHVPNDGSAWAQTLRHLDQYFEQIEREMRPAAREEGRTLPDSDAQSLWALVDREPDELASHLLGPHLPWLEKIGERTADLHRVLGAPTDDPRFTPLRCTPFYQRSLFQSLRSLATRSLQRLRFQMPRLDAEAKPAGDKLLRQEERIGRIFQEVLARPLTALRIRCHGSYSFDNLLFTGRDYRIFDFEGDLEQPVSERRLKRPALRDVAGLVWSAERASRRGLAARERSADEQAALAPWAEFWFRWATATILRSYLRAAGDTAYLPKSREEHALLLNCYVIEIGLTRLQRELRQTGPHAAALLDSLNRAIGLC